MGCSNPQTDYPIYSYSESVKTIKTIVPDDSLFYHYIIHDVKFIDDHRVLLCNLLPTAVYLYDFNDSSVTKIGNLGRGPGEYQLPRSISMDDHFIYIGDNANVFPMVYDKNLRYLKNLDLPLRDNSFVKTGEDFYYNLDEFFFKYMLEDNKGNGYFKVEDVFKTHLARVKLKLLGHNKKLYFVNYFENKLFAFDPQTKTENIIDLPFINTHDFSKEYDAKLTGDDFENRLEGKEVLLEVFSAGKNLLIQTNTYKSFPNHLYLVDTNGKLIKKYEQERGSVLYATYGNLHFNSHINYKKNNKRYGTLDKFAD